MEEVIKEEEEISLLEGEDKKDKKGIAEKRKAIKR